MTKKNLFSMCSINIPHNRVLTALVVMSILLLNGCGIGAVAALVTNRGENKMPDYTISANNQALLQGYKDKGYKVKLRNFTSQSDNNTTIKCRLMTPVIPPKHNSYAQYIEDAFQKELTEANLYHKNAHITLLGTIHEIDGGTLYGNAYWSIDMTLLSSNGTSYRLKSTYEYESSISAVHACSDMYKKFPIMLNKWIHDALKDPKFEALLKTKKDSTHSYLIHK